MAVIHIHLKFFSNRANALKNKEKAIHEHKIFMSALGKFLQVSFVFITVATNEAYKLVRIKCMIVVGSVCVRFNLNLSTDHHVGAS